VADRVIVWIPSENSPGWEVEGIRPHEARWVGGGVRSLHELAVAIAASGRKVELRGAVHPATLDELANAAGARPDLPASPCRLAEDDVVIVPEGIDDPAIHARLALSPARTVLMLLAAPGFIGWPFVPGWSRPDPLTVAIDAVARPEHFLGAAALGHELWTNSPGLRHAALAAGAECRFVGSGWPGGVPEPDVERDIDVVTMRDNRWAPLARPVARRLRELGIDCLEVPSGDHARTLEALARARVFLHPSRVEGASRLGCEARALGTVPVALDTNPYAVGLDEAGGAVALPSTAEMPDAVRDLLADPARLARLSEAARTTAREQVAWAPYVDRVAEALDTPLTNAGRGARSELGAALRREEKARRSGHLVHTVARSDPERPADAVARLERAHAAAADALADAHGELTRHKAWLKAVNESLSWRVTAPLRKNGAARLSAPVARAAARVRGRAEQPRPRFFDRPAGRLDGPDSTAPLPRVPVRILGWCLFPGSTVERVDVLADGMLSRRARLGVERLDVAALADHPDAPVSGFELMLDLDELPAERASVTLHAVAYAADGRRQRLEPLTLALGPNRCPDAALEARLPDDVRSPRPVRGEKRPLRVVAFTHELSYSGAALYLSELVCRLTETGEFEFAVVSFEDGPLRERLAGRGIPVHLASMPPLVSPAGYEHRLSELRAWLGPQRFDAALVNAMGAFPGASAALDLGIPTVWSVHESLDLPQFLGAAFPPGQPHPHVRARVEQAIGEVAALVFPARATQELFAGYAEPGRLMTLPYGIELADIDAARRLDAAADLRRDLGIAGDARVVLCLGSIEPRKCQAMLTQAFARVAAAHPTAQLVLVGKVEAGRRAGYVHGIEEYLIRSGLTSRVRIEPVSHDPYSFHSLADVVVCASDLESLPRSVVEAMAFEKPVLSTAVYGIPELIDDGVTGYLCEPRDVGALTDGLDRVLRADPAALRSVARAGSARVRERHEPERQGAAFAEVLEAAAAESRGSRGLTLAAP
jgi:glycosyltransferase involved in cell wall biosynthesis